MNKRAAYISVCVCFWPCVTLCVSSAGECGDRSPRAGHPQLLQPRGTHSARVASMSPLNTLLRNNNSIRFVSSGSPAQSRLTFRETNARTPLTRADVSLYTSCSVGLSRMRRVELHDFLILERPEDREY